MRESAFTPDIIIETIKHSNLPTILVEGSDDILIYRKIENKLGIGKVDFIPCGGRNTLLEIFRRKNELQSKKVFYIADRDMWVFVPIPHEYAGIHFTKGYCIENDLYLDGEDLLTNLFTPTENQRISLIISNIVKWYAFEVKKVLQNNAYNARFADVSLLNPDYLNRTNNELTELFLNNRNYIEEENEILNEIKSNIKQKFRGKYLFQIFELIFQTRNNSETKYHRNQLFDLCFVEAIRDSQRDSKMNLLINAIKDFLN